MMRFLAAIAGNPTLLLWLALGAFGLGLASGGSAAWWVQGVRLDSLRNQYTKFKQDTEALGKQAEADKKAKEAADKLKEEASNAKLKTALSDRAAADKRLRDERSSRGFVPEAPADSRRPDLACYDRAELDGAIRQLDEEVSGLSESGTKNTLRLKSAQEWALPEKTP